jgi:inner membrane protein
MASAFSHIAIPIVLYVAGRDRAISFRLFALGAILSVLPDADVIAFSFGIPYASPWGHRGFTHSLFFAAALALFFTLYKDLLRSSRPSIFLVAFVSCASHALLDALTNGGLGVALLWPLSEERFFFPFRPIEVSPIGIANFFTERGLKVIVSEFRWVIAPAIVLGLISFLVRRRYAK